MRRKTTPTKRYLLITSLAVAILFSFQVPGSAVVNDAGILNNQGVEQFDRGNIHAAEQAFLTAIEIDPLNPTLHANLGYAYQAMNNHERAIKAFKKSLSMNPTDLDVHNNLGVSLYNMGLKERALAEWEFILAQDPTHVAAAGNLGMIRNPSIADEIIMETRNSLMSPVEKEVLISRGLKGLFERGKTAYLKERYDEAIDVLTRVVGTKPSSKYSHYYLGMSYAFLNRNVPAMRHLREYLILESYPPESKKTYEESQKVFKLLQQGEALAPRIRTSTVHAASMFQQGKDAYRAGDYFKAINILNQVYNFKPISYPTNYYLGLAYQEVEDRERAVFHLSKCLLSGPEDRSKAEARKIAAIIKKLTY